MDAMTSLMHRARRFRAGQSLRNRRFSALTADPESLPPWPRSATAAASDSPPRSGYNQIPARRPELADDDVRNTACGLVSEGDQAAPCTTRSPSESLYGREWMLAPDRDGRRDSAFEEKNRWLADTPNACLYSDRAAWSNGSEGWPTTPPGSPSAVGQPLSVPTSPESSPRRPPCPPLWDSFQRFSFQKGPAPGSELASTSPAGEAASAAVVPRASGPEGIGIAVGPELKAAGLHAAAAPPILHRKTPPHDGEPAPSNRGVDTSADGASKAATTSPSSLKRCSKFLASIVTVVPVSGRATRFSLALTPAPAAQDHEQTSPVAPSPMQQPPESLPIGAVTSTSGPHPPSHEGSIARQLDEALESTIASKDDDGGKNSQPGNHANSPSRAGQWPLPAAAVAPRPPDDEGGPFNFSRPALSRGGPRSTAPSPISTPQHYHPDALTPGKASAPTSPTAAHFLPTTTPTTPAHGQQELASGSSPRMQNPHYHGSGYPREPPSRARAAESTASFRSHCTASTAPPTSGTERSSVTRGTSVTSMDASYDDEEPIVDEVMRMYEKGFYDDTDEEEEGEEPKEEEPRRREPLGTDTRPVTPASGYSLPAATHPLAANPVIHSAPASPLSSHPPLSSMPPSLLSSPAQTPPLDSSDVSPFDQRPAFSPIPEDLPAVQPPRRGSENRDSGKSMGDCEKQSSETLPPHSSSAIPNPEPTLEEEDPDSRDRYGFKKANQYITREAYDAWNATYTPYLDRRRWKWVAYMKESNLSTDHPNRFPPPSAKTKRFIRKGIPPEWRGAAWFYYAGGPALLGRHAGLYDRLVKKSPKPSDADIIERDLHRTFPDNEAFRPPGTSGSGGAGREDEPPIISALRRVLYAFSIHNPKIGYCQSLNFIAGLLLLFVPTEEQTFWLLNIITQTLLPGTHETSLEGSKVDLGVLMTALRSNMPELWEKLAGDDGASGGADSARPGTARSVGRHRGRRRDATPITKDRLPPITITMAAWFMSCFIGTLPVEPTLRVWDVFFYEGSKTLFRAALAILKVGEAEIAAVKDPMEMFAVVQGIPRKLLDANELMDTCFRRRNGFGGLGQGVVDDGRREMREEGEKKRGFFRRRRRDTDVV